MDSCFGLVRPHQHGIASISQANGSHIRSSTPPFTPEANPEVAPATSPIWLCTGLGFEATFVFASGYKQVTFLRDAILASHSMHAMFLTEKFLPLDGSSPVLSHLVFDYDFITCAVLEDAVCFASVREDHYAGCRASNAVSRQSPPACSVMPGVSPSVDLPPLLPCAPKPFPVDV